MVDIEDALTYPLERDDWPLTVGIGGGIVFVQFVVLIFGVGVAGVLGLSGLGLVLALVAIMLYIVFQVPLYGYYVDVVRTTIDGDDSPPQFEEWPQLIKDGLVPFAVNVGYMAPMLAIGLVVALGGAVLVGVVAITGAVEELLGIGILFGTLLIPIFVMVLLVYVFVIQYFVPISIAIYAHEGDIRLAFSPNRIFEVAFTSEFVRYWLIALAIKMVVGQIVGLLALVLVGFFLQFFVQVVVFRLYGVGYAEAMDLDAATV